MHQTQSASLLVALLLLPILCLPMHGLSQTTPQPEAAYGWTLSVQPHTDVYMDLITTGNVDLFWPGRLPTMPEARASFQNALATLGRAISQLRLSGIMSGDALSVSLGTKDGEIAAASLWINPENGDNGLATDLMDLSFLLPREQVQQMLAQFAQMGSLDVLAVAPKLADILLKELDSLAEIAISEQGSYAIDELGSFTSRTRLLIGNHELAFTMNTLMKQVMQDEVLREAAINLVMIINQQEGLAVSRQEVLQQIGELQTGLSQVKENLNHPMFYLETYQDQTSGAACYVLDSSAGGLMGDVWRVALWQQGDKHRILFTSFSAWSMPEDSKPEDLDWSGVFKSATDSRENSYQATYPYAQHLALSAQKLPGNPESGEDYQLHAKGYYMGNLQADITGHHQTVSLQPYAGKTQLNLSYMGAKPVLTLTLDSFESQLQARLLDTTGWPVVGLDSYEANRQFTGDRLPMLLLIRAVKALPDVAEDILDAVLTLADPYGN